MYTPKEYQLAQDVASALDDPLALSLYRNYAATIPEKVIRDTLAKVLSIPNEKIKRNRAALFTHLIEQYKEHGHKVNSGH